MISMKAHCLAAVASSSVVSLHQKLRSFLPQRLQQAPVIGMGN